MKGKITIGKVTCCGEPENDYVSIRIEDELSNINFVDVKMDIESFGKALLGLGSVPVEFELRGLDRVGKKFEHKEMEVMITHRRGDSPGTGDIDAALSKNEIDGWKGDRGDCTNMHKRVRSGAGYTVHNVHFFRWVELSIKNESKE